MKIFAVNQPTSRVLSFLFHTNEHMTMTMTLEIKETVGTIGGQ